MISEKLYDRLMSQKKATILNVMLEALEEMQSYNGQSVTSAVMKAVDAKPSDRAVAGWTLPTRVELDERFRYPPLLDEK